MFSIAGMNMNQAVEAFPDRRFMKLFLSAPFILNLIQNFDKFREGDVINYPEFQLPSGTKVLGILPDFHDGMPDYWTFLLFNEAWEPIKIGESIPRFDYVIKTACILRRK